MDVVNLLVNIKEGACLCVYVRASDFLLVFAAFLRNHSSIQSALHFLGLFITGDPAKCTVEYGVILIFIFGYELFSVVLHFHNHKDIREPSSSAG